MEAASKLSQEQLIALLSPETKVQIVGVAVHHQITKAESDPAVAGHLAVIKTSLKGCMDGVIYDAAQATAQAAAPEADSAVAQAVPE